MNEIPASLSVLYATAEDEMPRGFESSTFAVFWRDEFGTVQFMAQPDEWWDRWFEEHPEHPATLVREPDGQERPGERE